MDDVISVTGLKKNYDEVAALRGVSFSVRCGECFCLLGPNGAGKTTTLRIITGFLRADAGQVRVSNIDVVCHAKRLKGNINIVPQHPALDPLLTVEENLRFFGLLQKLDRPTLNRRIVELLQLFDIEHIRNRTTYHCSGGEYQRLLVARAFLKPAQIVFLDEPTSGIDILLKNRLWSYFNEQKKQGLTIFLNTHDLNEAEVLSDRIGFIFNGKIIVVDSPERLKRMIAFIKIRVEIDDPGATTLARLREDFPNIHCQAGHCTLTIEAPGMSPTTISTLHDLAGRVTIQNLEVQSPTLNDVFVKLGAEHVGDPVA